MCSTGKDCSHGARQEQKAAGVLVNWRISVVFVSLLFVLWAFVVGWLLVVLSVWLFGFFVCVSVCF